MQIVNIDLKAEIALYDLKIDSGYNNTIYFDNKTEQEIFFNFENQKILNKVNFDFGDILNTTIQISKNEIDNVLNYNYLVLKYENEYYYYFITRVTYRGQANFLLSLKLDILQTYFIKNIEQFKNEDAYILRMHLNRFYFDEQKQKYIYNYKNEEDNFLILNEFTENNTKFLKAMYPVQVKAKNFNDIRNLYKNFQGGFWIYVFLDKNFEYPNTEKNITSFNNTSLPFKIFAFYGGSYAVDNIKGINGQIYINDRPISYNALTRLLNGQDPNGQDFSGRIKGVKISTIPPFVLNSDDAVEITACGGNWINGENLDRPSIRILQNDIGNCFYYIRRISTQLFDGENWVLNFETTDVDLSNILQNEFTKEEILQKSNDLNPQLLGENFTDIRVKNSYLGINGAIFNPQILGDLKNLKFTYFESIQPEQTTIYIAYSTTETNALYNKLTDKTISQYTFSVDMSFTYNIDAYASFLSQNKNFNLQRNIENTQGFIKQGVNLIGNVVSSIATGGFGITGIASSVSGFINQGVDIWKQNLQIDNIKNSNSTIAGGGNMTVMLSLNNYFLNIEVWQVATEKYKEYNDYLNLFGSLVNAKSKLSKALNTRNNFNFLQARLLNNNLKLPNYIYIALKEILENGVRFFNNYINFGNFDIQNYEKYFQENE